MGLDIPTLIERIEKDEIYPILFTKGYGDSRVLQHRILDAIEEFVNNIAATETRFDKAASQNEDDPFINFEQFSHEENMGKTLYLNKCASCHSFDHKFTQKAVANNGLDLVYEDKGVGEITKQASDNGVFKVPFLRNIEKTGPYMHDGRFKSLREVINHYSEGIQNHPNLSTELKLGGIPRRMNFSEEEKDALEAYLLTLTDNVIEKDDRFSDPFIQ